MIILFFLLLFFQQCCFTQIANDAVTGQNVVKIAKCYMDVFYMKVRTPDDNEIVSEEGKKRFISYDEAIIPYFAFSNELDACFEIKSPEINVSLKNLFKSAGLDKWLLNLIKKLREEYNEVVNNDKPTEKQTNEIFVNENIENYNLWLKNSSKLKKEFKAEEVEKLKEQKLKIDFKQIKNIVDEKMIEEYIKENKNLFIIWSGNKEKIKNLHYNNLKKRFNKWRRRLGPLSLLLNSAYLKFAQILIEKFNLEVKDESELKTNLSGMLIRIKKEIKANINTVKLSFLNYLVKFNDFEQPFNSFEKELDKIEVVDVVDFVPNKDDIPEFPKVKRVIWIVRHAERYDNISTNKKKAEKVGYYGKKRRLGFDNTPLNLKGIARAKLLNNVFSKINVNHLFASIYERTIETARFLLGGSHTNIPESKGKNRKAKQIDVGLKIKLEPGFVERLSDVGEHEVGIQDYETLAKHHNQLDKKYKPIYNLEKLEEWKKVESKNKESDLSCTNRMTDVLNQLLDKEKDYLKNPFNDDDLAVEIKNSEYTNEWLQPEEKNAEQIVIVFHGIAICGMLNTIGGRCFYVPQTSITKAVELEEPDEPIPNVKNGNLENLRLTYIGVTEHLAEEVDESYYCY